MIDYERANNYDHGREGLKKALLKGQTHKQLLKVNFSKNPAEKTQLTASEIKEIFAENSLSKY